MVVIGFVLVSVGIVMAIVNTNFLSLLGTLIFLVGLVLILLGEDQFYFKNRRK